MSTARLLTATILALLLTANVHGADIKQSISDSTFAEKSLRVAIVEFSNQIQEKLGLNDSEVGRAAKNDMSWIIGKWRILAVERPWNEWQPMLEVVPSYLPANHGYRNRPSVVNEPGWHYLRAGTGTETLPPENTRTKILALIN